MASVIAKHLARTPMDQSMVFALLGPWGSGKTSVLHLIEHELKAEKVEVIWFNPWLFSGEEQIAAQFIRELALQLGQRDPDLKQIGEVIEAYGGLLEVAGELPVVGWIAKLLNKSGAVVTAHRRESVSDARARVEAALREKGRRFVVFVDDIDRLDGDEIRRVFKVVRLVADFPNVSYLLSFDRPRVEHALGMQDLTGRAYLAKIVQASFDLPPIEQGLLSKVLFLDLDACLSGREHATLIKGEWPDIFHNVISPLIKTPRDVRRFVNAVGPAVDMVGKDVALEDLLALEAVRVFLPDVFDKLPEHIGILTVSKFGSRLDRHSHLVDVYKQQIADLVKLAGDHGEVVRELCRRVFLPARSLIENHNYADSFIRRWRKQYRVAYRDVFEFYLERSLRSGNVRAATVRELVEHFSDARAIDEILSTLSSEEIESAVGRLEDSAKELASADFEHGFAAMLRHADRLRRGRTHMLDFGADIAVTRLLLKTLKRVSQERRMSAVKSLFTGSPSFTWRIELIDLLTRKRNEGEDLFDSDEAAALSATLKAEILAASPETIAADREPGHVVQFAGYDETTKSYSAWAHTLAQNASFARSLLAASVGETRSFPMGSVAVTVKRYLRLKALTAVAGGEEALRTMLRRAVAAGTAPDDERLANALKLAEDYLAGRKMYDPEVHDPEDDDDDDA